MVPPTRKSSSKPSFQPLTPLSFIVEEIVKKNEPFGEVEASLGEIFGEKTPELLTWIFQTLGPKYKTQPARAAEKSQKSVVDDFATSDDFTEGGEPAKQPKGGEKML